MARLALCATLALLIWTSTSLGQKIVGHTGPIKKFDAETGVIVLTVTNRKTKESKEMEFKVLDDTKVTLLTGEEKQELVGKVALKNKDVKEGATTTIFVDKDKIVEVRISGVAKKK